MIGEHLEYSGQGGPHWKGDMMEASMRAHGYSRKECSRQWRMPCKDPGAGVVSRREISKEEV
jgi:hypothetical protein